MWRKPRSNPHLQIVHKNLQFIHTGHSQMIDWHDKIQHFKEEGMQQRHFLFSRLIPICERRQQKATITMLAETKKREMRSASPFPIFG